MTIRTKSSNALNAHMKTRAFPLSIKAVDEKGMFEGYGSVFGVRDSYNEVVVPGAFVESLVKHKREGSFPLMLWMHDPYQPIGTWEDLAEDNKGLFSKGQLVLEGVPKAVEAHALLKARAVQGLSIGYREVDVEPAKDGEPRRLIKLDLMEISIVSFPANRRARVESVKADEALSEFARRLRDGEPPTIKEFEDILREAGVPKSMATQIASVGYAKAIRSESEGDEAKAQAAVTSMSEALASLRNALSPQT